MRKKKVSNVKKLGGVCSIFGLRIIQNFKLLLVLLLFLVLLVVRGK